MGYSSSLLLLSFLFTALLIAAESTQSANTDGFKDKENKYSGGYRPRDYWHGGHGGYWHGGRHHPPGEHARRLLAAEEKPATTEAFQGKEEEYYGSYGHGGGYGYGHRGGYGHGRRGPPKN